MTEQEKWLEKQKTEWSKIYGKKDGLIPEDNGSDDFVLRQSAEWRKIYGKKDGER